MKEKEILKMLTTSLSKPAHDALKMEVISICWRKAKSEIHLEDYATYFENYSRICTGLFLGIRSEVMEMNLKTHEDVVQALDIIWGILQSGQPCHRSDIRAALLKRGFAQREEVEKMDNSVNFVLRLWLHLHFQKQEFSPAIRTLQWDDQSTLQGFIRGQFPGPNFTAALDAKNEVLDPRFTAVNLYSYCGISIKWTYNLDNHLEYDREHKRVSIFCLKRCLQDQLDCEIETTPRAVLQETILSLNLLFPLFEPRTEKFLGREHQSMPLVSPPGELRQFYLSDFYHWRDRVAELYWEFQSPPPGWRQLVQDRRNPLQYYTFWFAVIVVILTIIFGIISSTTAIMQTRYAYEALLMSRSAAPTGICMCTK